MRGQRALVLTVAPFQRGGGVHGGHYALVWNQGGNGYAVSFHYPRADLGKPPRLREIRALTRAAESMRPLPD